MKVYTTLWNGDSWATRWGEVKLDLSNAPFVAGFKNFHANACVPGPDADCKSFNGGKYRGLGTETKMHLQNVRSKWVVYDYCRDLRRYAHGLPYECRKENLLQDEWIEDNDITVILHNDFWLPNHANGWFMKENLHNYDTRCSCSILLICWSCHERMLLHWRQWILTYWPAKLTLLIDVLRIFVYFNFMSLYFVWA